MHSSFHSSAVQHGAPVQEANRKHLKQIRLMAFNEIRHHSFPPSETALAEN
jgi:hypothetical protein